MKLLSRKNRQRKAKENISRDDVVDSKDLEKSACCDLTGCFDIREMLKSVFLILLQTVKS